MTNNLKAERTLTADELQAIIDGCEGLPEGPYSAHDHEADLLDGKGRWMALWHGDPIWHHFARMDPQTVKAMALELLALRSQPLSTQQPMGEPVLWRVKDYADDWIFVRTREAAEEAAAHGNLIQPLSKSNPNTPERNDE